jgi:hypothetical protein
VCTRKCTRPTELAIASLPCLSSSLGL